MVYGHARANESALRTFEPSGDGLSPQRDSRSARSGRAFCGGPADCMLEETREPGKVRRSTILCRRIHKAQRAAQRSALRPIRRPGLASTLDRGETS